MYTIQDLKKLILLGLVLISFPNRRVLSDAPYCFSILKLRYVYYTRFKKLILLGLVFISFPNRGVLSAASCI
jgi:hypothetical protein